MTYACDRVLQPIQTHTFMQMATETTAQSGFTTDELLRHYASIEAQGESVLSDRQQVCNDFGQLEAVYTCV